jgi:SPP1 gp7 family putative phage head morphogenesis protein
MVAEIKAVPPREAIAALFRRGERLEPSFAWQDVWQETHASMFTVAKSAGFDILADIYEAVQKALAEGKTFRDFAAELTPALQRKGWWGRQPAYDPESGEMRWSQLGSTRRLRTIFDVNLRVSYAAGHWASFERNKATRPFLRYVCILDDATRPAHRARHNLVLPVDHPYWDIWAPPCGWNCRCTLQALSQRDIDRMVVQGEDLFFEPPADTWRSFVNGRTGEVSRVPDGIDPGWAYNPGKAGFVQIERQANAKMAEGLFGRLERQWPPPPTTDTEIRKLADELEKGQVEWVEALTSAEVEAIETYKGDGFRNINAVLRDDRRIVDDLEPDEIEIAEELAGDVSSALGKARLPTSITTFRGIAAADAATRFAGVKAGETITDDGFYSSSLTETVAQKFGDFIIEARVQKGVPAMAFIHFTPDVNMIEWELLLDAGVKMKVLQVLPGRLIVEILRPK